METQLTRVGLGQAAHVTVDAGARFLLWQPPLAATAHDRSRSPLRRPQYKSNVIEITCGFPFQTVDGAKDAARAKGHYDRRDHEGDGLAAVFGARVFAGVVKKKLGLNLVSQKPYGQRIYRIVKSGAAR